MMKSEEEQLKDAEESEHAQMAGVIMRRMRQISMTESDNVVDIVKQVSGKCQLHREVSYLLFLFDITFFC